MLPLGLKATLFVVPDLTGSRAPSGRGTDVPLTVQSWTPLPVAAARMWPLGLNATLSGLSATGSTDASGTSCSLISLV